jgi:hypothetical protein
MAGLHDDAWWLRWAERVAERERCTVRALGKRSDAALLSIPMVGVAGVKAIRRICGRARDDAKRGEEAGRVGTDAGGVCQGGGDWV